MEDIWNQYDIGKYHNNTADKYQDEFIFHAESYFSVVSLDKFWKNQSGQTFNRSFYLAWNGNGKIIDSQLYRSYIMKD